MLRAFVAVALMVVVVAVASAAEQADTPSTFANGVAAYRAESYAEAISLFERKGNVAMAGRARALL